MTTDPKREAFEKAWAALTKNWTYRSAATENVAWTMWQAALASPACPESQRPPATVKLTDAERAILDEPSAEPAIERILSTRLQQAERDLQEEIDCRDSICEEVRRLAPNFLADGGPVEWVRAIINEAKREIQQAKAAHGALLETAAQTAIANTGCNQPVFCGEQVAVAIRALSPDASTALLEHDQQLVQPLVEALRFVEFVEFDEGRLACAWCGGDKQSGHQRLCLREVALAPFATKEQGT